MDGRDTPATDPDYQRGYREQRAWLSDKTLGEARHALASRDATVEALDPYNQGARQATGERIAELQAPASRH